MMKKLLLLMALVFSGLAFSQSLNDYKYASVPGRFSIFKNDNYVRLNVLTKLMMKKYGFESYLDTETQPVEFASTNCNKVFVDLIENNTMFVTKVTIVIKDCKGVVLATSGQGTSREKDYQVAYNEALRKAFDLFPELINYKYNSSSIIAIQEKAVVKDPVKVVKTEEAKPIVPAVQERESNAATLYAQPIANGYQLIDSEPKVILKIYKSSDKNVYIAVKGTAQGVLIAKSEGWFFEYYQNDRLMSEKVDVKF